MIFPHKCGIIPELKYVSILFLMKYVLFNKRKAGRFKCHALCIKICVVINHDNSGFKRLRKRRCS